MKRSFQAATAEPEQPYGDLHGADSIPEVCFIPDICRALGVSRRTVERLLRFDAFPIPEMAALDNRHRWSGARVRQFRDEQSRAHGRQSVRLRLARKG